MSINKNLGVPTSSIKIIKIHILIKEKLYNGYYYMFDDFYIIILDINII